MELDPATLEQTAVYKILISSVVPRPIAWVSSIDAEGIRNVAPFSYFMAITDNPPTIAFSSSPRAAAPGAERGKKDTLRNVEATREFVVNIVDDALAEHMNLTSGDYPPEIDAATGRLDMHRLRPVGRLCGNLYTHVHDIFEMKRPGTTYRG
ncbi:MAG: hypothetical protein DME16_01995 [Candidatus Rokuibacteriota bacterium]|nr:MAG: hypothetical protein DME16_01995 [Candidatus Rokubacteria bacterium]